MGLLKTAILFEELDTDKKRHSISVATVAKHLAISAKLSDRFAYMCGLFHDIGYVIDKKEHNLAGYNLLAEERLDELAVISLLHSFGTDFSEKVEKVTNKITIAEELKDYIELVTVADFIVNSKGEICGTAKRYKDIIDRYGEESIQGKVAKKQLTYANSWLNKYGIETIGACIIS